MAKILAVDDEPAILEMIESILNKDGHLVTKVKYSLQGTTQSRYLTGGVPPVRFSM